MDNSIRIWHDTCFDAFAALLKVASSTDQYAEQLPYNAIVDLSGRFNVWAGNIGAGQGGRASLDYRLREAEYIKEAVIRTLKHLSEAIQDGTRVPYEEVSSESESSASSSSSDLRQDKGEVSRDETKVAEQALLPTELSQTQHAMSSFIKNLFQISIIVRKNPAPHDRLVKSAKIDTSFYEFFDERHVQEKYPHASQELVKRLGLAISKRRKYFKYREQHRQKLSASHNHNQIKDPVPSNHIVRDNQSKSQIAGIQKKQAAGEEALSLRQSTTEKKSTKASTFVPQPNQAPLNLEVHDQQSDTATQTTYASVQSLAQDHLRIPTLYNVSKGDREFECPFCYTIVHLRSHELKKQEKEWKQHVLRDLQPYICTFVDCSQANTLYDRRAEWMRHEVQYHRREWSCNATGHEFYKNRTEFEAHMRTQHKDSFAVDHLDSVIDMLERPAISSRFSCPLCCDDRYGDLNVEQLEKHLGYHLAVVASFALPSIGDDIRASDDSIAAQDARHNDHESSQSGLDTDGDAPHTDVHLDNEKEADDDITVDDTKFAERQNISLHELDIFKSEYGQQLISQQFADHVVRSWAKSLDAPLDNIVSLSKPTSEDGASLSISDLIDQISYALLVMLLETDTIHSATQFMTQAELAEIKQKLRYHMNNFVFSMTKEIVPQDEQSIKLLEGLSELRTQLSLSTPLEAPVDSDQDWGFLHAYQSPPEACVETEAHEEHSSVKKLCRWLSPIDQSSLLSVTLDRIYPGTCEWLEKTSEYKKFKDGAITVLLLQGYPGMGKTTQFAKAIQELQHEADSDNLLGIAYYFHEQYSDDLTAFFRSLICQLINQANGVPPLLQAAFRDSPNSSRSLSLTHLEMMLEDIVQMFKRTIIAVDALDKLGMASIRVLSRLVRRLWTRGATIQLVAFSRTNMAVEDALWDQAFRSDGGERSRWMNSLKQVYIDPRITVNDIQDYVEKAIDWESTRLQVHERTRDRVAREIILESEGLFSVAASRVRIVQSCESASDMVEKASEGPHPADALWREILLRVLSNAETEDTKTIHSILEMLCVCERSLNAEEIDGNLRRGSITTRDKYDIWRRKVPALCELAIKISGGGADGFKLIHRSIKRFLQSAAFQIATFEVLAVDPIQAQRVMTARCLAELLKSRASESFRSKYGWTAYAGTYWHTHAKKLFEMEQTSHDAALWRDCTQLLHADTASFTHWIYMTHRSGEYDEDEQGDFGKKDTYPSPLYYASLLGLPPSALILIENGWDVNVKGGKYQFPILAAAETGEFDIVRLLLGKGANGDCRSINGDTALIRATIRRYREICEILLAAGVDPNIRNEQGETAAHHAVGVSHGFIYSNDYLESLQKVGANLDLPDACGRTPLHWAVKLDEVSSTKFLLSAGVDFQAQDKEGFSSLHLAAYSSHEMLAIILEREIYTDDITYDGRTPLFIAAGQWDTWVVQEMLEKGADVEAHDIHGRTPLHEAARSANKLDLVGIKRKIVILLLRHGADPSCRDENQTLPEHVAKDPVIKRLLHNARTSKAINVGETIDLFQQDDRVYLKAQGKWGYFKVDEVLVGRRYKLRDPLGKTMENIYAENDLYGRFR